MAAAPKNVDPAAPAPKKKSKVRLLIIAAVVVLVAGGAGAFFMLKGGHGKGAANAAEAQRSKPSLYLQMDPAFVVNFQDDTALRFLQVGVNVMSHDPDAIAAVREADPEIRNALLMLFSAQDVKTLSDVKGKQKLQASALGEVQRILKEKIGRPGVDALYFTSFIMQ